MEETRFQPTLNAWFHILAAVVMAGCAATRPARAAVDYPLNGSTVTATIEDELLMDPAVSFADIEVSTIDGVVTLSGEVDNLLAKERAVAIAGTVKGVRSVVDQIEVTPPWTVEDWEIEQDAQQALFYNSATDSWEIEVAVENNMATLTGSVDSWQEKNLAATVVKGVRGITDIENDIVIEWDADRSDQEIRAEVDERLRWDVLVDDALIDVQVDDGRVELTGTVGSVAERSRAREDAWVTGVEAVDTSGLDVEYWARDKRLRKDKYVAKSDTAIKDAVETAMFYDPRVNSMDVTTKVDGGYVTLRGTVGSLRAKRAAERDAWNTVGVLAVKNRIKVEAGTPTDEEVENRVEDFLSQDPYVERYEIGVEVRDGEVTLTGEVDTYFEKSRADDLAAAVYGVEGVDNKVEVDYEDIPIAYDPYVYTTDPTMYLWYDYEPDYTFATDAEIADEIDEEMWWSPWVDTDEIRVDVDNGVATLKGRVETRLEEDKAVEEAFEGGATWVVNEIEVE
jgi:osmotically-inducible protein OsmY